MSMPVHRAALLAAISVSFFCNKADAQADLASAGSGDATNLPGIEVTATRHAQTVDAALASVTVITRADIERSPATDLIGLLAQQAGVDISRTGGAGQSSTVFLRGANSNQTLVLIDGVRVASTGQGVFDFAHLPLDQIERIEIVRGPRAAFWGSDAIGGVIHIFTRKPEPLAVRAEAGSYGLRGGSVSLGTPANSESRFGITLGDERLRGFSATNPENLYSFNPDNDGYRNRNLSLRGSTPLGTQTLGISAIHTDANVQFDAGPTVGKDTTSTAARNSSGGLTLTGPVSLGAHWSQALTLGEAREDLDTPVFGERSISRRTSLDWVNTLDAIASGTLTFGGNWQRERGTSISAFSINPSGIEYARTRTTAAAFVGYGAAFGSQRFELAARHDHNSQFGGATTGSAAWGWQINPATKVRASWGQGFRAPNFNELYSPGFFGLFAGNPGLQPERSRSVEAGLEFAPATAHVFTASLWRTRVSDLIAFDGPNFGAINIARADLDGAEFGYRYHAGQWSAGTSITVQNPRNADTGEPLLRRPKRKLAADLSYDFGNGLDIAIDGLAASARKDFGDVNLHSYALLNLAAGWNIDPAWRLHVRLGNLFDAGYELAQGYNTPGRNLQISLAWRPIP
jgi:vitamin B12 transporter